MEGLRLGHVRDLGGYHVPRGHTGRRDGGPRGRTARRGPRGVRGGGRRDHRAGPRPDHRDQIIATLAAQGTDRQRAAVRSAVGQAQLLAWAAVQDATTFAITVARWTASIDPGGLERAHRDQRAHRFLAVTELPHGTVVKDHLDTAAGRILILALEALNPRPAPDDRRNAGQHRADALQTMATTILAAPHTTPGAHLPAQVSFLLTA